MGLSMTLCDSATFYNNHLSEILENTNKQILKRMLVEPYHKVHSHIGLTYLPNYRIPLLAECDMKHEFQKQGMSLSN